MIDISWFIGWFTSQVILIIQSILTILESIGFAGTNMLTFMIVIMFLGAALPILLNYISQTKGRDTRSGRVKK